MNVMAKTIALVTAFWVLGGPAGAAELDLAFLGTRWGTPLKDLQGYTKVGGKEKISYYVNPQRTYTFFGTEASDDVVYGFYDGKFFAVYVDIDGIDIFSQIKSYIQHKYGVPNKTSRQIKGNLTTYTWRLQQTQIKFKHHETSGKMKVCLYYLPIAKQVNSEMAKNLEAEPPFYLLSPLRSQSGEPTEFMNF